MFIYVGSPDSSLERRLLLRWGKYGVATHEGVKREADSLLARRYAAVEAAKSSQFFGIIVGSVAVVGVTEVCSRLEKILEGSSKQYVRLLFGKLTVAKLGNVPEVDCFVLVSCPQHEALYSREYPKPIVTPFDIEVAYGTREWSDEYKLDLSDLLLDSVDCDEENMTRDLLPNDCNLIDNRLRTWSGLEEQSKAPALALRGQHGVASVYY